MFLGLSLFWIITIVWFALRFTVLNNDDRVSDKDQRKMNLALRGDENDYG